MKFLTFSQKKAFLIFSQEKIFLIFQETETPKKNPNILENKTPKNSLYFRKRKAYKTYYISGSNFPGSKNKKTHSKKTFYIYGNRNL